MIVDRTKNLIITMLVLVAVACATGSAPAIAQANSSAPTDHTTNPATSYAALADVLENEAARTKLIEQLRSMDVATTDSANNTGTAQPEPSAARQLATVTQNFANSIASKVDQVAAVLQGEAETGPVRRFDVAAFMHASVRLFLVVLATVLAYLVLRKAAGPVFTRAGQWANGGKLGGSRIGRRVLAVASAFSVDLLIIVVATGIGYALGLFVLGQSGSIGTRESLFLNAFVMIEAFKAVIRLFLASRYEGLRLIALPEQIASWWSIRLRSLAGIIGYALLVLVPIINMEISRAAGGLVGLVIMLLAYAYALYLVLGNRKLVGARLEARATQASTVFFGILLRVFGKTWHWLAAAYFTVLLVVSQIAPEQALPYMVRATVESGIAIAVGLLLSAALTQALRRPLRLNQRIRRRVPSLEHRLNTYVPSVLYVARLALLLTVIIIAIDAWEVFSLGAWLTSGAGKQFLAALVQIAIILLVALGFWTICASILEARMEAPGSSARTSTLMALLRNAMAIVIGTITFMVVLSQVGVDIGPLIAGAGVIGLAVGFGAQKLVQDVITGVFIQIDNAMNTGDWVAVAGVNGGVERLSIRSVCLRDLYGTYHVIPFSSTAVVSNYSRDFGFHVGEYRISLREDIDDAITHLRAAFDDLKADSKINPYITDDLTIPGVTALTDSSVNIRAMIKTTAGMQWAVGRAYNRVVKIHFDAAGIEIPHPHRMLYFGADKEGNAHPAPVHLLKADAKPAVTQAHPDKRGAHPADTDFNQRDIPVENDGEQRDS